MVSINSIPALLAVDVGNTQIKWGLLSLESTNEALVFSEGVISERVTPTMFDLHSWLQQVNALVAAVIVSSVRSPEETRLLCDELQQAFPEVRCTQLFPQSFRIPFPTQYNLSELGADRLMNILGLFALSKKKAEQANASPFWIAVDAGTCCTVDVYHLENGYLGGWILPGLQMQAKAMTDYTACLPDISEKLGSPLARTINQIGTSTETSMLTGLQLGYPAMILGVLNAQLLSNYPPSLQAPSLQAGGLNSEHTVILTGGDAPVLEKALSPNLPRCRVERQLNFMGLKKAWQLLTTSLQATN